MSPALASLPSVGDRLEQVLVEDLTRTQIAMYAGASGDFHPFHHDEAFAKAAGSPRGIFAHGMLTMALAGKLLSDAFGADALDRYSARFVAQVWPGDTLTASATVLSVDESQAPPRVELELAAHNQDGELVLTGSATARFVR